MPKHIIVETTDRITGRKSYKIFENSKTRINPPVATDLPTREVAEQRLRELEQQR